MNKMTNGAFKLSALSLVLASAFALSSCEKVLDDITETATSAEDVAAATTAVISAFDIVDDVAATDERSLKNGSSLIPDGVNVVFEDTSFDDGDGVYFFVDFGAYNEGDDTKGVLCPDGKYRAGRIEVRINKPYTEIGSEATVTFPSSSPYYSGDGKVMNKVQGEFGVKREATEELSVSIDNAEVTTPEGDVSMSYSLNVKRTKGEGEVGTYGDEFELTGNGSGINRDGKPFTIQVKESLVKKVEDGCSGTFIAGVLELKNQGAVGPMTIDFDHLNNLACDALAEVTLPGGIKQVIEIK